MNEKNRGICEYLIVREEPDRECTMDKNMPFDWPPRCAFLKKQREETPELDRQFGKFDSCCMVATMPNDDISQWPQWCPPTYDFKELSWAMYNHYLPSYPQLKNLKHCSICGTPIILSGPFNASYQKWVCRKCWAITKDLSNQPIHLTGGSNSMSKPYYDEDEWK